MDQDKDNRGGGTGSGEAMRERDRAAGGGLENNIRNVRAILDQARSSFGSETRRLVDEMVQRTASTSRIEGLDLEERLDPSAWTYLAVLQLTELVNALVIQHQTVQAGANAMATAGGGEIGGSHR